MATIQTVQPGPASPGRTVINANFAAINAEMALKETAIGAQAKADAAQAAAVAASATDAQSKANTAQAAAIAAAATDATTKANSAQAAAVQRSNHTGTQAPSTIATDASNRFVTDSEKATWSAKQAALANAATLAKIGESGGAPLWNGGAWPGAGGGSVTAFSIANANGVSGSVANPTTTPALTITLGAITPSSVAATGNVTGANLSGTNTGDQTTITGNAGTATKLQTARTINGVSFDGSANITVTAVDQTARDSASAASTAAANALARANHTGTQAPSTIVQDASNRFVSDTEKATWNAKETTTGAQSRADAAQSAAISAAATDATTKANAAQAAAIQRANHTGTQAASTVEQDSTHRFVTDEEKATWNAGGGGGMTNPMTAPGDIIVGGAAGAPTRLPTGAKLGWLVTMPDGSVAWASDSTLATFEEDFIGGLRTFGSASGGAGATVTTSDTSFAGAAGVVALSTGTTAAGRGALALFGTGTGNATLRSDPAQKILFRAYVRTPAALSSDTENYSLFVGLNSTFTSYYYIGSQIGFDYRHSDNGGKWRLHCRTGGGGGTETIVDTGVTVAADTTYRLEWFYDGSKVTAWINGVQVAECATDIPAPGVSLGPYSAIAKSAGTTPCIFYIDYIGIFVFLTR